MWYYSHGQQVPKGLPPHMLMRGDHHISLLDQYGSPTKCKKVRSCDICIITLCYLTLYADPELKIAIFWSSKTILLCGALKVNMDR